MNRREFCMGVGSAAAMLGSRMAGYASEAATTAPAYADTRAASGFTLKPLKKMLFFDYRHICPNDLAWKTADGESIQLYDPEGEPIPVYADHSQLAYGIRLEAQPATKGEKLDHGAPGSVFYEDGIYKSWGFTAQYPSAVADKAYHHIPAESITVRYGESKDGHEWSIRDTCKVDLTKADIARIGPGDFLFDPKAPPQERYKAIFKGEPINGVDQLRAQYRKVHPRYRDHRIDPDESDGLMVCMYGIVSPDGENWTLLPEPLFINKGDTDNNFYYDEYLGKYVCYTRLYWMSRRMIARNESDDFRHWTPVEPIILPQLDDALNSDLYTNVRTSYPGEPSHHLMFPLHYDRYDQTSVIRLYSSIDGIRWLRVPGEPVISNGPPGSWDGAFIGASRHLVPLGKDRVGIRYWGNGWPHKYPRWKNLPNLGGGAWATWPRDRISAVVADEDGQFSTFVSPLPENTKTLKLNVSVRKAGMCKVGIYLGEDEGTFRDVEDCDPIVGDHMDYTVTWKGSSDIGAKPGQPVRLFFRMRDAKLFAAEWV